MSWKRVQSSILIPERVVYGLLAGNVLIFSGWQLARFRLEKKKDTYSYNWMVRHFTCSKQGVWKEGRLWTLLTSQFSHIDGIHLFSNMFMLYGIGPTCVAYLGASAFLRFYLASGVASELLAQLYNTWRERQRWYRFSSAEIRSLGASGSLMGVFTHYCLLHPTATVYMYFAIPIPAILL
jgi:membrane associated rhomboid family serine protease